MRARSSQCCYTFRTINKSSAIISETLIILQKCRNKVFRCNKLDQLVNFSRNFVVFVFPICISYLFVFCIVVCCCAYFALLLYVSLFNWSIFLRQLGRPCLRDSFGTCAIHVIRTTPNFCYSTLHWWQRWDNGFMTSERQIGGKKD